jgi:hypothetical protein
MVNQPDLAAMPINDEVSPFSGKLLDGLEFCSKAYSLFQDIQNSPEGVSRLRMRSSDIEKKLVKELLPICAYVQASYRPGRYLSIQWERGNQPYDAKLIQHGRCVELGHYPQESHIEVTCAVHQNEYLQRELLENEGCAFDVEGLERQKSREIKSVPVFHRGYEFIDSFSEIVQCQIKNKACKGYPDNSILIVQCTLNRGGYCSHEWELLMESIEKVLPAKPFREFFFYDTASCFKTSLYPPAT